MNADYACPQAIYNHTIRLFFTLCPVLGKTIQQICDWNNDTNPFCNCYVGHRSGHSVCQTNIVKGEETHFSVVTGVAIAVVTERKCFWLGFSKIEGVFCT